METKIPGGDAQHNPKIPSCTACACMHAYRFMESFHDTTNDSIRYSLTYNQTLQV